MAATRNFADVIKKKLKDDPVLAKAVDGELEICSFGQRLKEARMAAGLSQEKLSSLSSVSANTIGQLERCSRRAFPATAKAPSKALGINPAKEIKG